jgi:hypothetical protein
VTLSHTVLLWILSLSIAACVELGLAMLVVHAVVRRHRRIRGRAMSRLSLAFARYATGSKSAAELAAEISAVPSDALWETLEDFADAVSGDEWRKVAKVVCTLPNVHHEIRNLEHGAAWRRALAARHMGMLADAAPFDRLRAAMERGPMIVTLTAALALARLRDREALRWLLAHPQATQGQDRQRLTALLKRFGASFVPDFRSALAAGTCETAIGLATIEVLGVFKDAGSHERLESILRESGLEARASAARALGAIHASASIPSLCEALKDSEWQVRAQAARALGTIGSDAPVEPLSNAMSDSSWWVRRNAAYALARHGEAGLVALLRQSQFSSDRFVREMTVEVLQMLEWDRHSHGGLSRVE